MYPTCKVSPGFCLLVLWFAYANGWALLGIVLSAAVLHEVGHCLALRLVGGRFSGLRLGVLGAVLETDSRLLTYGRELFVVLAGPCVNILAAWALTRQGMDVAAGAHLVLAFFNLLPLWPLDGGRALELAVSWVFGPEAGYRCIRWAGTISAAVAGGGLLVLVWVSGGSLWLLSAAGGILAAGWRCARGKIQN